MLSKKWNSTSAAYYPNALYEVETGNGSIVASQVESEAGGESIAPDEAPSDASPIYLPFVNGGTVAELQGDGADVSAASLATNVVKYYYFNGQRVAMKDGSSWSYLHGDHLGSTVLKTNTSGNAITYQSYYAYGRKRGGGTLPTDRQYTGQQKDKTGLYYYNARYYDPGLGQFVSPDTIVPDPSKVFDYNRYMYVRGNAINLNDPTGHTCGSVYQAHSCIPTFFTAGGGYAGGVGTTIAATAARLAAELAPVAAHADKIAGMDSWVKAGSSNGQSASNASQAGNSASNGNPNDFEPNKYRTATQAGKKLLEATDKADARAAIRSGIDGLSKNQSDRALKILGKGRVDRFSVFQTQNGNVQMISERAGKDGFQRLIYNVDSSGKLTRFMQEAYSAAGELTHVHDKLTNTIIK